jgi:hypothetical protein
MTSDGMVGQSPQMENVVSFNPVHGDVYSIQHRVTKFVSHLRQVGGFLLVLRCPPPMIRFSNTWICFTIISLDHLWFNLSYMLIYNLIILPCPLGCISSLGIIILHSVDLLLKCNNC